MQNGIHNLTREQYDEIADRENFSKLKNLARSPAHYRQALIEPAEDTDAMKLGRVLHLACFEPDRFRASIALWEGGRRYGKEWDAFRAKHKGRELLTQDEYQKCIGIQTSVRNHPDAMQYLSRRGQAEAAVLWTHTEESLGGFTLNCKGRLDFISENAIIDIKTTRDASPERFGAQAWNLKYYVQAAWYRDGLAAATGRKLSYILIAVESDAPHVAQVYRVPEQVLEMGRKEYRALACRLVQCRKENHWPGYADGELELPLPRWAANTDEEDPTGLGLVINH